MYPRMNAGRNGWDTIRERWTAGETNELTGHDTENAATEPAEQVGGAVLQDSCEGLLLIGRELIVDDATDLGQFSEMSTHCE